MPVWMGAKDVASVQPELLEERGVTAMLSFMQTGKSRKWVHKDFKCLTSGHQVHECLATVQDQDVLKEAPIFLKAVAMIVLYLARGEGGVYLFCKSCAHRTPSVAACLLMLEECVELVVALRPQCPRYLVTKAAQAVIARPREREVAPLFHCVRSRHVPAVVLPQDFYDVFHCVIRSHFPASQPSPSRPGHGRIEPSVPPTGLIAPFRWRALPPLLLLLRQGYLPQDDIDCQGDVGLHDPSGKPWAGAQGPRWA